MMQDSDLDFEKLDKEAGNCFSQLEDCYETFATCSTEERKALLEEADGLYQRLRCHVADMSAYLCTDDVNVTKRRAVVRRKYDQDMQRWQPYIIEMRRHSSQGISIPGSKGGSISSGISSGHCSRDHQPVLAQLTPLAESFTLADIFKLAWSLDQTVPEQYSQCDTQGLTSVAAPSEEHPQYDSNEQPQLAPPHELLAQHEQWHAADYRGDDCNLYTDVAADDPPLLQYCPAVSDEREQVLAAQACLEAAAEQLQRTLVAIEEEEEYGGQEEQHQEEKEEEEEKASLQLVADNPCKRVTRLLSSKILLLTIIIVQTAVIAALVYWKLYL